ncbi:MAG: tRNA pseudouridine(38-40) synthase TruA [SAR202 cluster bacterium Io17-Chloro-G9]|nr:MAG: tRNA pseudouridine(38-40) synthase TruA [SAR202 cluster bacterium Io17-Chloro-G9]
MVATIPHTSDIQGQRPEDRGDNPGRRLSLVVEYDGSAYAGFQLQRDHPTIQGEIEHALTRLTGEHIRIRGASRTDSGAHALAQVVDFLTGSSHTTEVFSRALNFYLPQDITVQAAYQVPLDFHSRLHATGRTYRYQVLNRPWPSPLGRTRWFWVEGDLNVAAMASAAQRLVGWHDFRPLAPGYPMEKSAERLVNRWDVWREDEAVIFECEANGFLRHQIRRANGLLLEVGKGRQPASVVSEVLAGRCSDDLEWQSIPAHGLCLMKVTYPEFPPHLTAVAGAEARATQMGAAAENI